MSEPSSPPDEAHRILEFLGRRDAGSFVAVGAGRPVIVSISGVLEAGGWSGVLIEPQPDLAAFLVTARRSRVFAVGCASPDRAGEGLALHVREKDVAPYIVMAPTRTLGDILDEADPAAPLDLLAVDGDGREAEVLLGFDFAHWQPRLILLRDRLETLRAHVLVRERGYRLIRRVADLGWYVPADAPVRASAGTRWRMVREYYLGWPGRKLRRVLRRIGRALTPA